MSDDFQDFSNNLTSPPQSAAVVIPDNDADLARVCRGINVAGSGTVRVTMKTGATVDLYVAAGIVFPVRAARIHATGTTASGIVALW